MNPISDCHISVSSMLLPVVAALAASLCLTPAVRAVARRMRVFAYPDAIRRLHAVPVPLWGGVAIYLALAAGLLAAMACLPTQSESLIDLCLALFPAAGLACLFGAVDDCYDLHPWLKLALQLLSIVPVVAAGYYVDFVVLFGCRVELGLLGVPLTVLWLLGCINALNLIDGMDGLASMVGLSTAAMMALIALNTDNPHVAVMAVILAAALAGFLIFNLPPASIFLGDSGSAMLGLVVGILGIQGSMKSSATLSITAPAVIMTLPMFDVLMAVVRRKLTGRRLDAGDRQHIHHRLLERGLGPWQVLCILGVFCLTTGAAAAAATIFRMDALAWITATTLIVLTIRLRLFGHYEFGLVRGALRRQAMSFAKRLVRTPAIILSESDGPDADDLAVAPADEAVRRKAA